MRVYLKMNLYVGVPGDQIRLGRRNMSRRQSDITLDRPLNTP